MNKKLIIFLLTAFTCAAGITVAHADCVVDSTSTPGKVIISGTLNSKAENELISIQILPQNVDYSTQHLLSQDKRMYAGQIKSGLNGEFSIELESNADYGNYVAYVSSKSELNRKDFWFTNKDQNKQAMGLLLGVKNDSTQFITYAKTLYQLLLLDNPLYATPDDGILEIMRGYVISENLTDNDGGRLAELYDTLCLIDGLRKGKVVSLSANIKDSDISDGKLLGWYNGLKDNSEANTYITARLTGKNYTSISDFYKKLAEAVVLHTVYKPNGAGNIKNILTDLSGYAGISTATIKDKTYALLAGNYYGSYAELSAAINTLNSSNAITGGGGGGGSSGGGSGGSSSGSSSPAGSYTPAISGGTPSTQQLKTFEDLEGFEWAREAILRLANLGIVSGTSEKTYEPSRNVKREECVKMLVDALGIPKQGYENMFMDVNSGDWFAPYVIAAKKHGVVNGISDNEFGCGTEIKREDLAVMIYNALMGKDITVGEIEAFADNEQISPYAIEAVSFVRGCGIITGRDGNIFAPKDTATRAEVAVCLNAVVKLIN